MDSENIEEVIQEGGGPISTNSNDTLAVTSMATKTVNQLWNIINSYETKINIPLRDTPNIINYTNGDNITNNGNLITNRPLLLSDLMYLLDPTSDISAVFNAIPIAQYKHLPNPNYLLPAQGGSIEESTLDTQEVSLPTESKEEVLPSLDIVEPISVGGSYKWSSHKKRKSARIRTKKNKKI
jgi:hypothetical protein